MTFAEAAVVVLRQAAEPLHFREITDRAMAQDLVDVSGSTPWHSMNGALRRWIRSEGAETPIVSLGDGYFALRAWGLPVPEEGRALENEAEDTEDAGIPGEITVQPRPDDVSPTGWKWHNIQARMTRLVGKLPRHPSLAHAFVSFRSLFVWSVASFVAGIWLRLGRRSPLLTSLSQHLIGWGGAGSAMSARGMYETQRYDQAVFAGNTSRRTLEAHVSRFGRLFQRLFLGGLIAALTGWLLRQASDDRPRTKGAGIGLLVQGTFLGVLGGLAAWMDPAREGPQPQEKAPDRSWSPGVKN